MISTISTLSRRPILRTTFFPKNGHIVSAQRAYLSSQSAHVKVLKGTSDPEGNVLSAHMSAHDLLHKEQEEIVGRYYGACKGNGKQNIRKEVVWPREKNFTSDIQYAETQNSEKSPKVVVLDDFLSLNYADSDGKNENCDPLTNDSLNVLIDFLRESDLQHCFFADGSRLFDVGPDFDRQLQHAGTHEVHDQLEGQGVLSTMQPLVSRLKGRIARALKEKFISQDSQGVEFVEESGAILSWLSPQVTSVSSIWGDKKQFVKSGIDSKRYDYTVLHVDKANNFEYDYSCLLYLGGDFCGGDLVFVREEQKGSSESGGGASS